MKCGCRTHGEPIVLCRADWEQAIVTGAARQLPHAAGQRPGARNPVHEEGNFADGIMKQIHGAGGEIAAGIALGIKPLLTWKWEERHLGDLEGGHEVRTRPEHWQELPLREPDDATRRWILVVGLLPKFYVLGWAYGMEVKQDKYLRNNKGFAPTYYLPHKALRPLEDW